MASSPQHEPTMEEILASIRKIISEDASEPAKPAPAPAAAPAPMAAAPQPVVQEADVLELTQVAEEEPSPAMEEPAPPPPSRFEPAAPVHQDVVFQPIQQEAAVSSSAPDEIFSDKTRRAISDAFDQLEQAQEPVAPMPRSQPSFRPSAADGGDSVEAVFERAVSDAVGPHVDQWLDGRKDDILASLRPLIREWMDEHFPALLEGAVRDEVARVLKARGRR